jgi:uncharacterized repeat protein (TIGR01451 family)
VVRNTGAVTLTNVRVTDPLAPNCNRTSAQIPALATMAPGASVTYTCSRPNVTQAFTNTATDTGTPPTGPDVSASDSARVRPAPFQPAPQINIVKDPNVQTVNVRSVRHGGRITVVSGGTAHFTIKVTNTGNVTLHAVTVTDPLSPGCNRNLGVMTTGTSKTYTCTRANVKKRYTNLAKVVGTSPTGQNVRDQDTARVNIKTKVRVTG